MECWLSWLRILHSRIHGFKFHPTPSNANSFQQKSASNMAAKDANGDSSWPSTCVSTYSNTIPHECACIALPAMPIVAVRLALLWSRHFAKEHIGT